MTIVITGASRGIGAAAAAELAARGMRVALVARDHAACEAGGEAMALGCDVSSWAEVSSVVAGVRDAFGGLDVLVNNAGVIEPISLLAGSDPEGWGHAIDINLKGVYHGMRAAMPVMTGQGGGTIITISSGAAHGPVEAWSHYCASKAGAAMLTRCADKEGRDHGIRAMGLSPGTVATQMQREIKSSGINPVSRLDWSDHIPPEWVATALMWMCGPAGDAHLGEELSLRDEDWRRQLGLVE